MVRKLREHHRKMGKGKVAQGNKTRSKKDPGIPSMFPGKQEFIDRIKSERELERQNRTRSIATKDNELLASRASVASTETESSSNVDEWTWYIRIDYISGPSSRILIE